MNASATNVSGAPRAGSGLRTMIGVALSRRNSSVGQGAALALGTTAGRGAIIVGTPLLTRLYTPADFGVLAVLTAIVSFCVVAACWRYEGAIALARTYGEALNLSALCGLLLSVNCTLLLVAVLVWGPQIARHVGGTETTSWLWVLPGAVFASGAVSILTALATQRRALGGVAVSSTVQSLGTVLLQALAGLFSPTTWSLVFGDLAGRGSGAALLALVGRWRRRDWCRVSIRRIWSVAARHAAYPKLLLWAALINTASTYLPVVVLALVFDDLVVGLFALSMRVASLPVLLLGKAIGQVFLSRARRSVEDGVIASRTRLLIRLLAFAAFPYVGLLIAIGEELFAVAFGDAWRDAGVFTAVLAPYLLIVFVASPISTLALVHQEERSELAFQLLLLVARLAALCTCFVWPSPLPVIAAFSAAGGACWAMRWCWLVRLSGNRVRSCLRDCVPTIASTALIVVVLLAIKALGVRDAALVSTGCAMVALASWPLLRSLCSLLTSPAPAVGAMQV